MVKHPAKGRFFFLNMGCPSIEFERDHLATRSVKQFDRATAGRHQFNTVSWQATAPAATQRKRGGAALPRLRFTKDASSLAANFFRPGV